MCIRDRRWAFVHESPSGEGGLCFGVAMQHHLVRRRGARRDYLRGRRAGLAPGPGGGLINNHMVACQLTPDQADRVFHALADRTRRDIVRRVLGGEASVSALGRQYPMSLAAVQKHVAVLELAGLVTKTRRGREQIVRADLDPLRRAAQLFDQLEALWRGRVDRMGELLAEPPKGPSR